MELKIVKIDKPADMNFILGQSHFIKTVEDLYEVIVQTVPEIKFGIGFCESSGPALVSSLNCWRTLPDVISNLKTSDVDMSALQKEVPSGSRFNANQLSSPVAS